MYFWNIEKLKTQLIEKPLSDKEVLPYLIITMALLVAERYLPQSAEFNLWDYLLLAFEVISVVAGTYWLYLKNKANAGSHFLQRYFAIGWVAAIRILVWTIPMITIFIVASFMMEMEWLSSDSSGPIDSILLIAFELIIYWYIGKHIANVAEQAKY